MVFFYDHEGCDNPGGSKKTGDCKVFRPRVTTIYYHNQKQVTVMRNDCLEHHRLFGPVRPRSRDTPAGAQDRYTVMIRRRNGNGYSY